MKKMSNVIRWILAVLMLCVMATVVASPALAEVTPLPLDHLVPGRPTNQAAWISVPGSKALQDADVLAYGTVQPKVLKYSSKTRTWEATNKDATPSKFPWQRYEDESISIRTEFFDVIPAKKARQVPASVTYIKVADPSQIRTAMSNDSYKNKNYVKAEKLAAHVNAVVAVNGDFFKYFSNIGYVLRQGEFYRDMLNGRRDMLIIDSNGDFHSVYAATSETAAEYLAGMPEGVQAINTFCLGPVLVENGQARVIADTIASYKQGEFEWPYAQQRVAVVQTGKLEYAIVEVYGKFDGSQGMNLQEMADLIAYLFPECIMAYNLDGGGSTAVIVNSKRIHLTPGSREISDILYFASAYTE